MNIFQWLATKNGTIDLKAELGSAPVTTLGVIFDSVICSEATPLWQRAVLPLLLSECAFCAESFL